MSPLAAMNSAAIVGKLCCEVVSVGVPLVYKVVILAALNCENGAVEDVVIGTIWKTAAVLALAYAVKAQRIFNLHLAVAVTDPSEFNVAAKLPLLKEALGVDVYGLLAAV